MFVEVLFNRNMKNYSFVNPYKSCFVWGALRYFSQIENSICLIHGPKGCSFFYKAFLNFVNKYEHIIQPKIYTTDFNERDVIFGGVTKLRKAIVELDNEFKPDLITIFNCCVSEVIGEDIKGVITSLEKNVKAKLIAVQGAGFKGDHKLGMKEACGIIFKEFIEPLPKSSEKNRLSINYIGELNPNNWSTNELISILSKFDIKVNTIIPTKCKISDFSKIPFAELNYLVCGSAAHPLVKNISKKFDIPFIGGNANFLGLENSKNTLYTILNHFNVNSDLPIILHDKVKNKVENFKPIFANKKAIVVGGTRRALGYSRILTELGFTVSLIFSEQDDIITKESLSVLSHNVLYDESPELVYKYIKENKPDIVMTTIPELVIPEPYIVTVKDFFGFSGYYKAALYVKTELEKNNKLKIIVD